MKTLTLTIAMLLSIISFGQVNLTDGLVAYYPFNGNANDGSGYSQNGVLIGNPGLTMDRFLNSDQAYDFYGSDYIKAAATALNLGSSDFSVVFWVKHATSAQYERYGFLGLHNATGDSIFAVNQTLRNITPPFGPPIMDYTPFSAAITNGSGGGNSGVVQTPVLQPTDLNPYGDFQWHMVAVTRQGTSFSMRIDTVTFSSITSNVQLLNVDTILIGSNTAFGTIGSMDDIMIYNRALSLEEIDSIYTLTASIPSVFTSINTIENIVEASVFPNPIQDNLQINFPQSGNYQIQIFDAVGRAIFAQEVQNANELNLNTINWSSGVYVLKIYDAEKHELIKKLVKM